MKKTLVSGDQTRRDVFLGFAAVSAVGPALSGRAFAASENAAADGGGSGLLRSAGVLAFGPDNVLLVGDITGAAVHAFALRATDVTSQQNVELGNFHNFEGRDLVRGLDQKLAALFGTTANWTVTPSPSSQSEAHRA
jgi:hypothetical protein